MLPPSPPRFEAVLAVLESEGYTFTAKGKTVLHEGWKGIEQAFRASLKQKQPEDGDENTSRLPELKEGQRFEKADATIREGKTSPPKHYTEDSLLAAMETAGAEDMPEDAERKRGWVLRPPVPPHWKSWCPRDLSSGKRNSFAYG